MTLLMQTQNYIVDQMSKPPDERDAIGLKLRNELALNLKSNVARAKTRIQINLILVLRLEDQMSTIRNQISTSNIMGKPVHGKVSGQKTIKRPRTCLDLVGSL